MPQIGASKTSGRTESPDLVAIHEVIVPDLIERAQDDSRDHVLGYIIDDRLKGLRERAIGYTDGLAEFHIPDVGSVALVPSIVSDVQNGRSGTDESIFSYSLIPRFLHFGSIVLKDQGLPVPALTFGIQDSKLAYIKATRLEIIERLDPKNTDHKEHGKLRSNIGAEIGKDFWETDSMRLVVRGLSNFATSLVTQNLGGSVFKLIGDGNFSRPLSRIEDFVNGLSLSALANNDYELALKQTKLFDDPTLSILAASIGYLQGRGASKSASDKVMDYWDHPSDLAAEAMYDVVVLEKLVARDASVDRSDTERLKREIEKLVVESVQTSHRTDTQATLTPGSLRRSIYGVTDPETQILQEYIDSSLLGGRKKKKR